MFKFMVMMKRKPGITREEFRRYYEEVHAPAALKRFPIRKYVRNYVVVPPGAPEPGFDCITEFWYDSMEDARSTARIWKHQGGLGDETSFIDAASEVSFQVEEGVSEPIDR
jgi:uncharacterized protein (TIGR02118 family)